MIKKGWSLTNTIASLLFLVVALVVVFWIARGIFTILAWAAPILLLVTLFINYRIVWNYLKYVWSLLQTNLVMGVLITLLTIFGFPLVVLFLFGKALLYRKLKSKQEQVINRQQGEYAEYEEVPDEKPLILPPLEKRPLQKKKRKDKYDRFFGDL